MLFSQTQRIPCRSAVGRKTLWKMQKTHWDTHRWYLWDSWQGPWGAGCSLTARFGFSQFLWKMPRQGRRCEMRSPVGGCWSLSLQQDTLELADPPAWCSQAVHAAGMPWDTCAPQKWQAEEPLWAVTIWEHRTTCGVMTVLSGARCLRWCDTSTTTPNLPAAALPRPQTHFWVWLIGP